MEMYPDINTEIKKFPLQSLLFGHRIQPSQTKYEYLIEFLQVALAEKRGGENPIDDPTFISKDMFPVDVAANGKFKYLPRLGIGLKRFIFFPKSKLDGRAEVDKQAYNECVSVVKEKMTGVSGIEKENSISIIQNLLTGFSAVNQSRSWFDQNVLPICPEVILPEGLGVKKDRQDLSFSVDKPEVDGTFSYNRYTYMCRGGEVYYLHLLNALSQFPEYRDSIETGLSNMVHGFPQFSYLCKFIQQSWEGYYTASGEIKPVVKELGAIPLKYSVRNQYTVKELKCFLSSKAHPFEKMETFANGIILQILRMMYLAAESERESNCWVIDVNCAGYKNAEAQKCAIIAFKHNEEVLSTYLYDGLKKYRSQLNEKHSNQKIIKDAADDSYRLFRKLGKMIGIIIPNTGKGMRFSLSEDIIKFLVLSIIPPKQMITLDEFINCLHEHFGMVIGPEQYLAEMNRGSLAEVGDFSFLQANVTAFAQKLKECGFLRDLSDATAIVENPYEREESNS